MKLHRRFILTLAAILALAIGSGGGWALAQDNESGGSEHSAVEPSGDDGTTSEPASENEAGENEASGEESDNSSEGTATVAAPTETVATFTG